jgi:predicted transcriptional regulator with HTH domain
MVWRQALYKEGRIIVYQAIKSGRKTLMGNVRGNVANRIKRIEYNTYFSLERSSIRIDILMYLKMYPSGVPIFDISQNIKASYTNTKGAILGDGKGYNIETSLASLGLVTCSKVRGALILYMLTSKGREIARLLEESGYKSPAKGGKSDKNV